MKLPDTDLCWIDYIWRIFEQGHPERLVHFELSDEDLESIKKYKELRKNLRYHGKFDVYPVIYREDANKLVEFFKNFGVKHELRDRSLFVTHESFDGYDSRDDIYRWMIYECFVCRYCLKQVEPDEYFVCKDCKRRIQNEAFDPAI